MCWNVKPEIIKLLEENIGENVHGLKWSKDFLHMIPNVQSIEKNSQIGHYQNYELMLLKNTVRMKRHL